MYRNSDWVLESKNRHLPGLKVITNLETGIRNGNDMIIRKVEKKKREKGGRKGSLIFLY